MSITPTNNLAKLGIAAAHAMRIELADQLFSPIAVNIHNPAQVMMGGSVGNRTGQPRRLASDGTIVANPAPTDPDIFDGDGAGGNTAGYAADFNGLEGDPVSVIKTMTSDGPIFTIQKYSGTGIIMVDDPRLGAPVNGEADFTTVARYLVKADGVIYDLLDQRGTDTTILNPAAAGFNGPYRHWELAAAAPGAGYTGATNSYTPPIAPTAIQQSHYTRPVGRISFRPKDGASAAVIQENLGRAQSTLDLMSRLLRSLHDEAKGPFSNIVVR